MFGGGAENSTNGATPTHMDSKTAACTKSSGLTRRKPTSWLCLCSRDRASQPPSRDCATKQRWKRETESRWERVLDQLPAARWNLRVGDLRVLYRIIGGPAVQILRVILKGTSTTDEALARSVKP